MLYPQQNDFRNVIDLSGFWDFNLDPGEIGELEGWFSRLPDPRVIAVPGSWNEQFQDTRDYMDAAWYLRAAYVPQGWQGQKIYLRVGSANYAAKIWVNGVQVGEHLGGHLPFAFEITEWVAWDGPNTIAIRVENRLTSTRVPPGNVPATGVGGLMGGDPSTNFGFFPYGGIHRPVMLYTVPPVHIEDVTVVTEIEGQTGIVRVSVLQNGVDVEGRLSLTGACETALSFIDGRAEGVLRVPNARLWPPEDPHLYPLTVTLNKGDQVVDRYCLDVGIRTVAVDGDSLLLNGQPIFLIGFGKHEDFPIHGRGLNVPLIVKDNALLKWVGQIPTAPRTTPTRKRRCNWPTGQGTLHAGGLNLKGVFTRDRRPKMAAHFLRDCWAQPQPKAVLPAESDETPAPAEQPSFIEALSAVAQRLRSQHPDTATTIKFDVADEGVCRLILTDDGRCLVEQGDGAAAATIQMQSKDAVALFTGQLNPMIAFTTGKIKAQGDMQALMTLQSLAQS